MNTTHSSLPTTRLLHKHWFWLFIVAIPLAAFLVREYALQSYVISGGSMTPTYSASDRLLVEKLSYRLGLLSRGDVLVFRNPHDKQEVDIKRIVGMPQERVVVTNQGVIINDAKEPCDEKDINAAQTHATECRVLFPAGTVVGGNYNGSDFTIVLGSEDYFVLGDNRSQSTDSRSWGTVQKVDIIGKVVYRL